MSATISSSAEGIVRVWLGRFRGSGVPSSGTQDSGAHALARAFSRDQGAVERDAGVRERAVWLGRFRETRAPLSGTHDIGLCCWRRVTLNASLRLDSLRSLGSAHVTAD